MAHPSASNTSPKPKGAEEALATAVLYLALHLVLNLAIRISNTVTLARAGNLPLRPLGPPFSLPFILGEELLVGALIAVLVGLACRSRFLKPVGLAVAGLYLIFLAFDQLLYKIFFSHLNYPLYADCNDILGLWSSVVGSMDASFAANLALALASAVLLWLPLRPRLVRAAAGLVARHPLRAPLAGLAYIGLTVALVRAADQRGLQRSFPFELASSYARVSAEEAEEEAAMSTARVAAPASKPVFGKATSTDDLAAVRAAIAASPGRLNVVWYLMESSPLRETSLDPSNRYDTTPFVKELARTSLLFRNYYSNVAASTRSFFSSLTGLYPFIDKASDLSKYSGLRIPTVPRVLHDAGYTTAFFASSDTLFDSLDTFLTNQPYDDYEDENMVPPEQRGAGAGAYWGVDEEIMIDRALKWIEGVKAEGKPFYVSYNSVFPHHPYNIPPKHEAFHRMDFGNEGLKSRYRAALRYSDAEVRRFWDGLVKLGVADDTLFIVVPDHGETFGDLHPMNVIHGEKSYDDDTHIFLLMHNPKALGRAFTSTRLGCQADFLPTLLDVLKLGPVPPVEGQSLVSEGYKERVLYFYSRGQYALRDGNYKFIENRDDGRAELYDLAVDPTEKRDIARANPEKVAAYKGLLRTWRASTMLRFKELKRADGLTDEELKQQAMARRRALFEHPSGQIAAIAVCPSGSCDASPGGGREFSFARGAPLSLACRWRKDSQRALELALFDPGGKQIWKLSRRFKDKAEPSLLDLPTELMQEPGRYRLRVFGLSFHAVHETRNLFVQIRE
ncbi:MAG: sulfatase-like hydrolase/transferase [Deltaproteobacteria bacterium]|nr:sulfatase-like hydrolase/transferase [Deltaproteobacteria bacterium]